MSRETIKGKEHSDAVFIRRLMEVCRRHHPIDSEYLLAILKLCESNRRTIDGTIAKVQAWEASEDRTEVLEMLEDLRESQVNPLFIDDMVECDVRGNKRHDGDDKPFTLGDIL